MMKFSSFSMRGKARLVTFLGKVEEPALCSVSLNLPLMWVSIPVPSNSESPEHQRYRETRIPSCSSSQRGGSSNQIPPGRTNPLPWAVWASPIVRRAPALATVRKSLAPLVIRRLSMLPPMFIGGIELTGTSDSGARPMLPMCMLRGTCRVCVYV